MGHSTVKDEGDGLYVRNITINILSNLFFYVHVTVYRNKFLYNKTN